MSAEKILVIDDEPTMIKLTKDIFELFNINADFVNTAEDGLELFAINSYSLILLDMKLPQMSGFEFFQKLDSKIIPVIITSGFKKEDVMSEFNSSKNVSFLQKPFSVQELIGQISSMTTIRMENNYGVV